MKIINEEIERFAQMDKHSPEI
jgi:Lon-like ATP-dependent protease